MDSCWYERGGCARCTLDSSSRPSQQGKGTDPGGLNLTGHRYTAMLEKRGESMIMARAGVYASIGETHWEVGCRCRLWGRSRRCAYGSGSGRNAACLWALASARRSSSSVVSDRNKRLPFHPPQGNKTPPCLGRNSLPFQTSTI